MRRHAQRFGLIASLWTAAAGIAWMTYLVPQFGIMLAGLVAWVRMRGTIDPGDSHGSAKPASYFQALKGGLFASDGVILGRADGIAPPGGWDVIKALHHPGISSELACSLYDRRKASKKKCGGFLRLQKFVHILTVAATGRGKSVSVLVPNLIYYSKSVVITDPKGELYSLTAKFRKCVLGQEIFLLDPFGITGAETDRLNPLDFIDDRAEDFLDSCRDLANAIVHRTGKETDPHWNDAAELVLCAFIAFVCACEADPAKRTLDTVRELLSSREAYALAIAAMQKVETHEGVIARLGGLLTWFVEEELGSVLTTTQRHTSFLDGPIVARNTSSSSFDPLVLRKRRASLYLVLPHKRLETLAPLQRLWIGTVLQVLTRDGADERRPVLFLLDEAAHLGKMRVLEDGITLMRGYGIRFWLFVQSLQQLHSCYGEKAGTILDNLDTQQFFGINSYESAEAISQRIGDTTVFTRTTTSGSSGSKTKNADGTSSQTSGLERGCSIAPHGRRLIRPEELITMPEEVCLLLHRNVPVVPATLPVYFADPEFYDYREWMAETPRALPTRRRSRGQRIRLALAGLGLIPLTYAAGQLFVRRITWAEVEAGWHRTDAAVRAWLEPSPAQASTPEPEPASPPVSRPFPVESQPEAPPWMI